VAGQPTKSAEVHVTGVKRRSRSMSQRSENNAAGLVAKYPVGRYALFTAAEWN
jgi:hypothetical protein